MKYNTVVIDPPWPIKMAGNNINRPNRSKELPYKTMKMEEIEKFKIDDFAEIGAHVYIWCTNSTLRKTFDIMEKWGVNFHLILVGVKPSGVCPTKGYVFATEFCVLGFYGKPMKKFTGIGKLNWLKMFNKPGEHSKKPTDFYNLIKHMSPEPRIDIFSRRPIAGFDSWGDESIKERQEELKI